MTSLRRSAWGAENDVVNLIYFKQRSTFYITELRSKFSNVGTGWTNTSRWCTQRYCFDNYFLACFWPISMFLNLAHSCTLTGKKGKVNSLWDIQIRQHGIKLNTYTNTTNPSMRCIQWRRITWEIFLKVYQYLEIYLRPTISVKR